MFFINRLLPSPLPHEHVEFELRRHWFVFVREAALYVILLLAPAVLTLAITSFELALWEQLFNGSLTEVIVRLALSLYYLGVWVFFWHTWVDYYLDVWVVTNERVLSLEQRGIFNRTVAELRLSRVQDVTSQVKGLWETFLHYGDVRIQTAGEQGNFVFREIKQPYEVAERLMRLVDQWHQDHPNEGG
ncbi:MAG: PH domain-containing protein [Candidatus Veblenbacteria bacterium]|nr:PH domain-containing protein [Candidatus Veblenbacteria bacterium]